jgi:putative transcriptional regulator
MMNVKGKMTDGRYKKMNSFQGQFLVAARRQLDPNFAKTVILVCAHAKRGAFGVIVSQSADGDSHPEQCSAKCRCSGRARLFRGGPVTGPLMAIHMRAFLGEWQILPGVFLSREEKNVLTLMWRSLHPCRIFTGYVGWGAGQLDSEVQEGTWQVVPATVDQIFDGGSDLWERLSLQTPRPRLLSMLNIRHFPLNPQWN